MPAQLEDYVGTVTVADGAWGTEFDKLGCPAGYCREEWNVSQPDKVSQVEKVLQTLHVRGQAVYGMKILGEGDLRGDRIDASLQFAMGREYLSGFTIGMSKPSQVNDLIDRIARIGQRAKATAA